MPEPRWTPQVSQVQQDDQQRMSYVRALMRDGRTAEAQGELQNLLQQDPQNTRVLTALAISHIRENDLEQSANYLEEVMRIDPKHRMASIEYPTFSG